MVNAGSDNRYCARGGGCAGFDHSTIQTANAAWRAAVIHPTSLVAIDNSSEFSRRIISGGITLERQSPVVDQDFAGPRPDPAPRRGVVRASKSFRVDVQSADEGGLH